MYCHEAFRCPLEKCPVRRGNIRRCWEFFLRRGAPPTSEECPYAPCDTCHYRMGWEIGLIGDSLFFTPETPDGELIPAISPEDLAGPEEAPSPPPARPLPADPVDPLLDHALPPDLIVPQPDLIPTAPLPEAPFKIEHPLPPFPPAKVPSTIERPQEAASQKPEAPRSESAMGQQGFRFCWEIMDCPNPHCPVRVRRIIRCFKFFEPRGDTEKLRITCGERLCRDCHYFRGWEMGILHEGMFSDVLEEKKLRLADVQRVKRQTLVELYLSELSKKPLNRQEELALAKKLAGDRDAAELFLAANLKLVVRIAGKFSNRGMNVMDLIQEGNIGLIKAIAKFDYTLGYRFSTYAAYWIRHYMQRAISQQGRTIRVPHHLLAVAHKIRGAVTAFTAEHSRSPSLSELSTILVLEENKILDIIRVTETPLSIEAGSAENDEDEAPMSYFLTDRGALSPEEEAIERAKSEAVRAALAKLPDRLREVIEWFYGFREETLSLAEIGRRLGLSRERTRQLLHQALVKLQEEEFVLNWGQPE
jgi:RNA polymerase primary sigma factor